jgi:hypothetical protein
MYYLRLLVFQRKCDTGARIASQCFLPMEFLEKSTVVAAVS